VNGLDLFFVIVLVLGILLGWWFGLLKMVFSLGGLVLGFFLAGRLSDNLASVFTDDPSSKALAIIVSYLVITLGVFILSQLVRMALARALGKIELEWADKVGGASLGFLAGLALVGGLVTVLARYTHPVTPIGVADSVQEVKATRKGLRGALVNSAMTGAFLKVRGWTPSDALGFVPDEFRIALDQLERERQMR